MISDLCPPLLQTMDEIDVAIKTCKADASSEDKDKFLEEACKLHLDLYITTHKDKCMYVCV